MNLVFTFLLIFIVGIVVGGLMRAGSDSSTQFPRSEEGVQRALREGRKIAAIKIYRELHSVGLKEAKDAVERIDAELQAQRADGH